MFGFGDTMPLTAVQVLGARAMLRMPQSELAEAVGITRKSLATFEAEGSTPRSATLERIRAYLEGRGIEFLETEAGSGILLRTGHQKAR